MDFTLCVLACAKNEKYKKRLLEFINFYGFKNTNKDINLKLVFLVEDEPRPDFVSENFDWVNYPNTPLSMRLVKYINENDIDSDWLMQVDDDSSTDIDKTCELLDQYYESSDCVLLMGGRNTDLESGLQNAIRKLKIDNFLFSSKNISLFYRTPYFIHAWEPSIFSNSAIQRIKSWSNIKEFMNICEDIKPIFSDQLPYVLAKLSKVPIAECLFLSPFCESHEYSAINKEGRFSHIHYVTENWSGYEHFKKNMIEVKNGKIISEDPNKGESWEFFAKEKGEIRNIGIIRLDLDGTVGIYENSNEKFWSKINEKPQVPEQIVLMDENKNATCVMSKKNDKEYEGVFLKNSKITHCIKKL